MLFILLGKFQGGISPIQENHNAYGQIYNKGMSKLISISKDERFFLESQGYKMHEHIFPTYTRRYKHYFAIETHDVLKCLKNYRRKCVIHK